MNERGHRRRAFHRVRQPGVQQELRGLAHRAHEQQQADERERIGMPAEEIDGLAGERRRLREDDVEVDRPRHHEDGEDAERETEIADTIDDEGLDRRGIGFGLVIPEPDQQIAREPHPFPAKEHLRQIVGGNECEHRKRKERQISKETRAMRVFFHVADGIKMHERRHGRDHHQHHRGQRIDAQRPIDLQIAGLDPGHQHDPLVDMAEADAREGDPRQSRGREQEQRRDQFGRARADDAAEKARDQTPEQREEDNRLIHG